jgi:hypothetical protein
MTKFSRGDVVVVDLGLAAKVRPCVVVSVAAPDSDDHNLFVPLTGINLTHHALPKSRRFVIHTNRKAR